MLTFFAITLLGCPAPSLPDPVVDHVEPGFAYNGDDETVTIAGEHFYPQLAIDAWQGDPDVDPAFRAWLLGPKGGIELARELVGVGIIDDRHLTATVESGLPAGTYDLQVESPTGRSGKRLDAFTVTDTQAVQLLIDTPSPIVSVTEEAVIDVTLADLGGDPVPVRFEVAVLATLEEGLGELVFDVGTLQDAEPTIDGDGVHGFIEDGTATLSIRSSTPDRMRVSVVPWDPASEVLSDEVDVVFTPGDELSIEIELPTYGPLPTYVAGEPFTVTAEVVDQYGNPAGVPVFGLVTTACSGFVGPVELDGPTAIEVVPEVATGSSPCLEDEVLVLAAGMSGASSPYLVAPGPVDHFNVFAAALPGLQAGDELNVLVDARDVYENLATWSGVVSLADSLGGPIESTCLDYGFAHLCTATVTRAGIVTILATGDDGTTGISNPVEVEPDDVPASAVATATGPAIAGEALLVEVEVADTWGNVIEPAALGVDAFTLEDDLGEVQCLLAGYLPGAVQFDCSLFSARSGAVITPTVPAFGLVGAPAVVDVVNGPLAVVSFAGEAPVVAGVSLALTLVGEDAWGNPYVVQADPVVELTDDSGTFSATSATLGPDGTGSAVGSFTRAGATVVRALQGGVELGGSATIVVAPATTDGLRLTPAEPWAWVGVGLDVRVEAVDSYGNRTDVTGAVTLSSAGTGSPPVAVGLVDGVGTGPFTWTAPLFVDTLEADGLEADGLGFAGATSIAVADDCGVTGPSAAATFGGHAEAVACVDPLTGFATVTVDLGGSSAGQAGLAGYALAELGGGVVTDSQPVIGLELGGVGAHPLRALVVDDAGCGSEIDATGWAGPDDGTPVGALVVVPADGSVTVIDSTTVEVLDVVDCSRDPAGFQEIEIRTTGGTLLGPTTSGSGLRMTLDANGDGAATLSTAGGLSDGVIEVHATSDSGAAAGVATLPVVGDNVRPIVVAQDPSGWTDQLVTEVRLTFSEPLLGTTVDPVNFTVTGPAATSVTAAALVGQEVTLTLAPAADGSLGTWSVEAASALRDLAGNKLAGDWSALAATYVGGFGGAAGAAPVLACTSFEPAGLVVRPDGDPGEGAEADELRIEVSAAVAPAWWVIEARDEADALVWHDRLVPVGALDTVVWGARDFRGLIVPNGTWRVVAWPDDGLGNRGSGCEVTLAVDNPTGWPP